MTDLITLTQHEYNVYKNGAQYGGKQAALFSSEKLNDAGKSWVQCNNIPTVRIPRTEFLQLIKPRQGAPMRKPGPARQARPSCPCFTVTLDEYAALLPRHLRHSLPSNVNSKQATMYVPTAEYARLLQRNAIYREPLCAKQIVPEEPWDDMHEQWVPTMEEELPGSPREWATNAPGLHGGDAEFLEVASE